MSQQGFQNELERALARPDVKELCRVLEIYRTWDRKSDDYPNECDLVVDCASKDPEMALALVILAAANFDNEEFLVLVAAGPLEDLLRKPSQNMLDRIVAEARKTPRFRWMLSVVYNRAIEPEEARQAVAQAVGHVSCETVSVPPRPFV